jgi:pyruvate dehydrogenase E2 component (dihydrolipoamide acetyltransferase)
MEEIFIPASGMAMEDVLFCEWLKQPGDEVAPGEPVAVVETDKSTVELSGTTAGRLGRHLVEAGSRVPGGTTVAYLLMAGETEPGAAGVEDGASAVAPTVANKTDAAEPVPDRAEREPDGPGRNADGRHRMSPRQRRAVAETAARGGRGPAGLIANRAGGSRPASTVPAATVPAATVPAATGPASRGPASTGVPDDRKATAALVTESWRTIPHFSVGRDLRVDGLLEAVLAGKMAGQRLTVTDFLLSALAQALESVGEVADLGLAVATEWGVLIPVLPSVAGLSLPEVAARRQAAVTRARNRRLGSADAAPVFATLSNLGPGGVTWFTGVIPLNQVALVTIGEVSLRPAVEGRGLVVAPVLTAVVTADHRRYDGADSARLLGAFSENLRTVIDRGIV